MSPFEVREEVLNAVLADLLSQHGLLSVPESILIESRIGDGGIRDSLFRDALARVQQGISPYALVIASKDCRQNRCDHSLDETYRLCVVPSGRSER
ncbi:MAG: hypothetical protein QN117_05390 [Armatimonadota bacterium]|nr:hypothetical protein [Armatimonadota bacterium]MDR7465785.1 hypothetical protein [Armatimonadota bacterium]MDR7493693.1 hypothetical protein [Armatimonadota bacterium]MDR7503363.1 hypothetical protein [Armatimonadota bacterium]MDR7546482.1 hypothetical protein [Armatimonadota bacterium]